MGNTRCEWHHAGHHFHGAKGVAESAWHALDIAPIEVLLLGCGTLLSEALTFDQYIDRFGLVRLRLRLFGVALHRWLVERLFRLVAARHESRCDRGGA